MIFSIIIPVYNRPQEVKELLESLSVQTDNGFEVIIVEDGSSETSVDIVAGFTDRLHIGYYAKKNGGPGLARNYGSQYAQGEYLIYLDSDCIAPPEYIYVVRNALEDAAPKQKIDAFGGPDRAASYFSDMQKAVNYSMTSLFTTGGIRGGKNKRKPDKFYPRSFNMGISLEVYEKTGGFSDMRFGEDIDLSRRIYALGYNCELITEAYVYHKRRTNIQSFFNQVFASGMARINLYKRYPDTMKLVYMLPAIFTLAVSACVILSFWNLWFIAPVVLISVIWFADSLRLNGSKKVAILSVATSFVQLIGYGSGFFYGAWMRLVKGKSEADTYKTKSV